VKRGTGYKMKNDKIVKVIEYVSGGRGISKI